MNTDLVRVNELGPRLKASPNTHGTPKLWPPESACPSGVSLKSKISSESNYLRDWFDRETTLGVQDGSIKCSASNLPNRLRKTLEKEKDLWEQLTMVQTVN